jgi:hypothetical protein
MSEVRGVNKIDMMGEILKSKEYEFFLSEKLQPKIEREELGWQLLQQYHGRYTWDILDKIFDIVDSNGSHWFGSLLATPNRRHMRKADPNLNLITLWIEELLFSNNGVDVALNNCIEMHKIKGARNGLATLLLYLSKPDSYNIWIPTTWNALIALGRITQSEKNVWGKNYIRFNEAAISFRVQYEIHPRAIDWILFSVWSRK